MNKIKIISDKNPKSIRIKLDLLKRIYKNDFTKYNPTIVIGGDGFMLQTLKKNKDSMSSFYGQLLFSLRF